MVTKLNNIHRHPKTMVTELNNIHIYKSSGFIEENIWHPKTMVTKLNNIYIYKGFLRQWLQNLTIFIGILRR
jgi:hypothetical protein